MLHLLFQLFVMIALGLFNSVFYNRILPVFQPELMKYTVFDSVTYYSSKVVNEYDEITCSVSEVLQEENLYNQIDPVVIKTCTYGLLVSKTLGTPDFKGRYSYTYKIVHANSQDSESIPVSVLFSVEQDKFQVLILGNLNASLEVLLADAENHECLQDIGFNEFNIDTLSVEFDPGVIRFHYALNVGGACMNVSSFSVELDPDRLVSFRNPELW